MLLHQEIGRKEKDIRSLGMIWTSLHVTQKENFYASNTLVKKSCAKNGAGEDIVCWLYWMQKKRKASVEHCIPIAGQNDRKSAAFVEKSAKIVHFFEAQCNNGEQAVADWHNWRQYERFLPGLLLYNKLRTRQ